MADDAAPAARRLPPTRTVTGAARVAEIARRLGPDIIIVASLLIAGWKYTTNIRQFVDIGLWDETLYLTTGINFLHTFTLPAADSAPLYAVWYAGLATLSPDPEALYYLNYRLVTVLPPLLLYLLLRKHHVSLLTSAACALLVLVSSANFWVWPKVNHFALIVLLAFLILAAIPKSAALSYTILGFGCLLTAYVRPEMFGAFIICSVISIACLFRERGRRHVAALASLTIIAAVCLLYVGDPLSSGRSLMAFGQHFGLNWQEWTGDTSLSHWDDWQQIVYMNFGEVSGIGDAVLRNPGAVAHHVVTNIVHLPRAQVAMFVLDRSVFDAIGVRRDVAYIVAAVVVGALIVLGRKTIWGRFRLAAREERRLLLQVCVVTSVVLLSCLIIYPRPHYILVSGTLLLAVAAVLSDPFRHSQIRPSRDAGVALCAALAIIILTPNLSKPEGIAPRPVSDALDFIRTLDITAETRFLSRSFGYTTYLADGRGPCTYTCGNMTFVPHSDKQAGDPNEPSKSIPFDRFLRDENVNMILVTDELRDDSHFRDDPQWRSFLEHPERLGFVKLPLPDGDQVLYVDGALLHSGGS